VPGAVPMLGGTGSRRGSCDAFNACRFERGTIRGVDVSGLSFINVVNLPGNVLAPGSRRVVSFVDDRASDAQFEAILGAYQGRLGGPPADLAGLVGEVVAVERAPIVHETRDHVARAHHHSVNLPGHGMVWSFEGRNAIQSDYRITYTAEP
jgi:hypothetical protein